MTPDDVVQVARSLIGVPYHHQGRNPVLGLDCIGLLVAVARQLNYQHVDSTDYGRRPEGGKLEANLAKNFVRVETVQPGDVVACRILPGGRVSHAGIIVPGDDGLRMVHSYAKVGKVAEHGYVEPWITRTVSVWRWRYA